MDQPRRVQHDPKWATSCLAYNLQANLGPEAARAATALQSQLAAMFETPLLRTPTDTMHVSLYGLVYVHWSAVDKEAYWQRIAPATLDLLARLSSKMTPFSLRFRALRLTESALIAVAPAASDPITLLRTQLANLLDEPALPRPRYDLVHTTLLRFAEPAQVHPAVVARIAQYAYEFSVLVDTLSVMRELLYPSLRAVEVQRYSLGPPP